MRKTFISTAIATSIIVAVAAVPPAHATAKAACDPGIPASKTVIKAITLASAKVISGFNSSACGAAATIHQLCEARNGWEQTVMVPDFQADSFGPGDWSLLDSEMGDIPALAYGVSYTPNNNPPLDAGAPTDFPLVGTAEETGDYAAGQAEVGGFGWACIGYSSAATQEYVINYSLGSFCVNANDVLPCQGTLTAQGELDYNQGDNCGFCVNAWTVSSDGLLHIWELDATIDDSGLVDTTTGLPIRGDHITLADDVWTDSPTFDATYNPCGQ